MQKKGMAQQPGWMFSLLVGAALLVLIYVLLIEHYIDVKTIVKEFQTERQTINLAQLMVNNPKLVYNDGTRFYRAILDKNKLNAVMDKGSSSDSYNQELVNTAYPNTLSRFTISDLKTGEVWSAVVKLGDTSVSLSSLISKCLPSMTKREFPVAIKSGDEVDVGKITVQVCSL